MAGITAALQDNENRKFVNNAAGDAAIRVVGEGFFYLPANADAFTVELADANLSQVFKFRTGGIAGTVVKTVKLTFATAQTLDLVSGIIT